MTSADRRRAHLRVGAATIGVFLLLLALGAGRQAAGASSGGPAAAPTVQPTLPYGGHRGFEPGHDRDRGFPGGGDRGFPGGPPDDGAPGGGGGTQT